jgi:NAD(P)-dependent dehydrogenase (short-subunit alcohol dehydrogenase family)
MSSNQVALVTGANKGIGFETARQLAQQGITVLLGARDTERGNQAAKTLQAEGLDVQFIPLDVTDPATLTEAAAFIGKNYGKLDILVNNAGLGVFGTPASEESLDLWRQTFEVNVFGLVAATQVFLPLIKRSSAGRIVHLSSILGSLALASDPNSPIGGATGSGAAYGATKSAVNMYTVHLARELAGTNIKVNAAHPGWVKTDMGGEAAPMEIVEGAKTSVQLATIPNDGPTGGYFHLGDTLPW